MASPLLVLLVLIAWIVLDYRAQRRRVAELEVARRHPPLRAGQGRASPHERSHRDRIPRRSAKRRLIVLLPLVVFLALAALFLFRLGSGDPSKLPSALIGRPVPDTPLPAIEGLVRDGTPVPGIASADFKGAVSLVNVWASWCVPCHDEAPLLMKLAEDKRIRMLGINYKDQPENARRFIGRYGNPFAAVGDRRERPRLDRLGRLRRARNLRDRPRRPHRVQAGRADHAAESRAGAQAADREGARFAALLSVSLFRGASRAPARCCRRSPAPR